MQQYSNPTSSAVHRRNDSISLGRLLSCGCVLVFSGLMSGCLLAKRPQVIYHASGEVSSYKRYERYPARNFFHHISPQAYKVAKESDFDLNTPEQDSIIELWGQPEYIRDEFKSLNGERVEEWVYTDRRRIFQFVHGQMAYEGDLTDLEQIYMRQGRPSRNITTKSESGLVKHFIYYRNVFAPGREESYNLANDKIVYSYEGN